MPPDNILITFPKPQRPGWWDRQGHPHLVGLFLFFLLPLGDPSSTGGRGTGTELTTGLQGLRAWARPRAECLTVPSQAPSCPVALASPSEQAVGLALAVGSPSSWLSPVGPGAVAGSGVGGSLQPALPAGPGPAAVPCPERVHGVPGHLQQRTGRLLQLCQEGRAGGPGAGEAGGSGRRQACQQHRQPRERPSTGTQGSMGTDPGSLGTKGQTRV